MDSAAPRKISLGTHQMFYPSDDLQELKDSSHLIGDVEALRREIEESGYLLIRGLLDTEHVLAARRAVLQHIKESGEEKLAQGHPWEEGILNQRCGYGCVPFMEGKNAVTHSSDVLRVLESQNAYNFFREFFGEEPRTFDFKWLRGVHNEAFTGAHVDNVYMGRGSDKLHTMWIPLGDIPVEMGVLAVCEGSHRLPGFDKFHSTYGNFDIEKENLKGTGWFTCDPKEISSQFGGTWKTTDFKAGDVLIFTMRTVHMSSVNSTHFVRTSCDTRWQPASQKADPRYVGDMSSKIEPKFGFGGQHGEKEINQVTIEEMKKIWGFET